MADQDLFVETESRPSYRISPATVHSMSLFVMGPWACEAMYVSSPTVGIVVCQSVALISSSPSKTTMTAF